MADIVSIERIEFKSGTHGYEPFELAASKHMDQNGYIGHYEGTGFSDVFNGDAGNTFVKAGAGNDVIIAGNGADMVEPGSGVDYINGGLNAKAGVDQLIVGLEMKLYFRLHHVVEWK